MNEYPRQQRGPCASLKSASLNTPDNKQDPRVSLNTPDIKTGPRVSLKIRGQKSPKFGNKMGELL